MSLRFLNDITKPWDELNVLLAERLALQPDLSDVTRLAGALAVAIRHQVDAMGMKDAVVNAESIEHRIISDTADFWKHGSLRDTTRNNSFSTEAFFEYKPESGFSFIRNALIIDHASFGQHDFLHTSLAAIKYWIRKSGISTTWQGSIQENTTDFHPAAILKFDPSKCISMDQVRVGFFSKGKDGVWTKIDPPEVKFEVY